MVEYKQNAKRRMDWDQNRYNTQRWAMFGGISQEKHKW
jgi:hypothetical protein